MKQLVLKYKALYIMLLMQPCIIAMNIDEINNKKASGNTLLHYAILGSQVDAVQELLEASANPYIKTKSGKTARDLVEQLIFKHGNLRELEQMRDLLLDAEQEYNSLAVELKTKDDKSIVLSEPTVSLDTILKFESKVGRINKKLTKQAWDVLLDLCAMQKQVQEDPDGEPNLIDASCHIFTHDELKTADVEEVVKLAADIFDHEHVIIVVLLNSYVVFTQNNIKQCQKMLTSLNYVSQKILDKYYYLRAGKHILSDDPATVSLAEYLEFNPETKPRSLDKDGTKMALEFNKHYLSDLSSWNSLFEGLIKPSSITIIDLSHNSLTKVDPELLEGFVNLEQLSLAYNKIGLLPDTLLKDCAALKQLDVSHNALREISPKLVEPCGKLVTLVLDHNDIQELLKELADNKPDLNRIKCDHTTTQIPQELRKYITELQPVVAAQIQRVPTPNLVAGVQNAQNNLCALARRAPALAFDMIDRSLYHLPSLIYYATCFFWRRARQIIMYDNAQRRLMGPNQI